ncbi:hypothetical protein ACVXG7_13920 [Enterobacter hormaechei]
MPQPMNPSPPPMHYWRRQGVMPAAPLRGPGCWVAWPPQVGLPLRRELAVEVAEMTITTARSRQSGKSFRARYHASGCPHQSTGLT